MADFNTAPYFDDFDEAKKFLKILFRPGYAVQTRELNQAQTILQDQVSKFGKHIFKEGSVVIPGELSVFRKPYIKVDPIIQRIETTDGVEGTATDINPGTDTEIAAQEIIGKTLRGIGTEGSDESTHGVTALAQLWQKRDVDNSIPQGFIIDYQSAANDTEKETFDAAERVRVRVSETDENNFVEYQLTLLPEAEEPTGLGTTAEVQRGIYFLRGFFALVDSDAIIIDAYSTTTPASIGFTINENFVTPEQDESLNDNANGTFNFAAPGAHRYQIQPVLTSRELTFTTDSDGNEIIEPIRDPNYIEVTQIQNGVEQEHVVNTEYSELEKALARRTFDESGNYSVRPFRVQVKEKRSNNRGQWTQGRYYLQGDIVTDSGNTYVAQRSGTAGPNSPFSVVGTGVADGADGSLNSNVVWSYEPNPEYNGGDTADLDQTQEQAEQQESQLTVIVEPGKAYVRGYEVEKISPERIDIQKARTSDIVKNDSLGSRLGNYIRVTNISGVPDIQSLASVTLRNVIAADDGSGSDVGTARIRGLEQVGDEYRLYLFNVNLNPNACFADCVKQIRNSDFSADIVNVNEIDNQGSISSSGTTFTGVGTRFAAAFEVNDYLEVNGEFYRVTAVNSDTELEVGTAPSADFSGEAYRAVRTRVNDPQDQLTIYPMFYDAIRTVKDEEDVSEVEYTVMQKFENITSTGGVATVSRTSAADSGGSGIGTRFSTSVLPQEILVTQDSSGIIRLDGSPATLGSVTTDAITINGLSDGTYTVFAPVIKEDAQRSKEKSKTLETGQIDITDLDDLKNRVISLGKADILRLVRVSMSASATGTSYDSTGEIDITEWFDLDNGQRDTHYALGSIVRKPEYAAPTGFIRIDFEYFSHGATGDYFSIDSYSIPDEDIPVYETEGGVIPLRNALDFRPVIDDAGGSFTGTGGSVSLPPKPGTELTATYQYYKGRNDRIAINSKGDVIDVKGTPSLTPSLPEPVSETMDIVTLEIPPYTYSPNDVEVIKVDNRRYTMSDIGDLERRIDRLEYYTSLNLLEQKAASIEIPDDEDPRFNRFKNGFIVDNFAGHNTGDTNAPDYRAGIDMEQQELRPTVYSDNVDLVESVSRDSDRATAGYQVTGDVVTLPYTQTTYINQQFATNVENINPYAVFTFIGAVSLNPFSDQWFETETLPAIVNDIEGNFNAVRDRAAEAGILGTVWNNWQTQWTGTRNIVDRDRGMLRRRNVTETRQTRTGIQTTVRATFEREVVEDRVVSTSTIPFIRSRSVAFLARNLKLGTRIYPYFDGVDVSEYVTPASRLEYTEVSGSPSIFDFETNAGANADEVARTIDGNTETHLNSGDVVFVSRRGSTSYATPEASPCTAVVQLQEVQPGGDSRSILVLNASGNFQVGDEITGTISGAKGSVSDWAPREQGDPLVTNFGGDLVGVFDIPNNDELQFRTGEREFKLIDNQQNNDFEATTRGRSTYEAEGTLRRTQQTINSVRNGEIARERVDDARTRTEVNRVTWFDPIAQTFLVEETGGLFITSLDLYFASVDPTIPVRLQIRDTVNGYPGQNVLPFGEVVLTPFEMRDGQPDGFGLSSRTVDLSDVDGAPIEVALAPDSPVRFNFKAPVYLQEGEEYCFVLLSDSNNYHVWVSDLGGVDSFSVQGERNQVSEQPYLGSFFKSQNASTWTPDQNRDMKFRLNRARFQNLTDTITGPDGREESINTTALTPGGIATFNNARLDTVELERDPLFARFGSQYVRILHRNHGFTISNSQVTLSGFEPGVYAGINASELNGTHDIVHVTHDSYVIKLPTPANETTRTGGNGVSATRNVQFDGVQPLVPVQSFPETRVDYVARTLSGQTVFGSETPYIRDSVGVELNENENNFFDSPRLIASDDNEIEQGGDAIKSFDLDVRLFSTRDNLSPVIDTSRLSLITFNNRISNPTLSNSTFVPTDASEQQEDGTVFDRVGVTSNDSSNIVFSGNEIQTENTSVQGTFRDLQAGQILEVTNAANDSNDGQYTITAVAEDGSSVTVTPELTVDEDPAGDTGGVNIAVYNNYVEEISPSAGTTAAKYMTRRVDLSEAAANSTGLDIRFAADVPTGAAVDVYYKTKLSANDTNYNDIIWNLAGTVSSTNVDGFTDQEFNVTNIPTFDIASVKLVLRSDSSVNVPLVKDLIVIANA
jgi:hypothetical protein